MKVSYKILKKHLPFLDTPEKTAQDLIMHTAEVETVEHEWEHLKDVFIGMILERKKHPDSEKLWVCRVEVKWKEYQIVCGAQNATDGIKVPVAMVWAKLKEDFIIEKTKIRWEVSEWMICSEDELSLQEERSEGIMILPNDAPLGMSMKEYLKKDDTVLTIDNKAINHRPDMFSYMWVMRELCVIHGTPFPLKYIEEDFTKAKKLQIENEIPEVVKRYIGLQMSGVANTSTPEEIKTLVEAAWNTSKGILVDITNYSLFMYGQPTHCFDADKIDGHIVIRFAKDGETILALDNKEYALATSDIVIADTKKVMALAWVIWGKETAVSDTTKNIIIESAFFPGEIVRHTGRRLWVRTDALNLFEKNISKGLQIRWVSLIYGLLKKEFPNAKVESFEDVYPVKEEVVKIPYDRDFINRLIGKEYPESQIQEILLLLGIEVQWKECIVPFWRKDMSKKADLAEEICRIDGFDKVAATTPRIDVGGVVQSNMVKLKSEARNFFSSIGFFDMYNYSFVNETLMQKLGSTTKDLIEMKNYLSEEITHLRNSLIPNLLLWIEQNIRERNSIQMFELEKVFWLKTGEVYEAYHLAGVMTVEGKDAYYPMQEVVINFLTTIGIDKVFFEKPQGGIPPFAHTGRVADIIVRGKKIGYICEIGKEICENFDVLHQRIWCFEINADILAQAAFGIVKAQELSTFQENNFDLSIVVDKTVKWFDIQNKIKKADTLIQKVELFDIYEDETKLPGKRSLSFKVFIQSQSETLWDEVKNTLIKKIISEVEKLGGKLR